MDAIADPPLALATPSQRASAIEAALIARGIASVEAVDERVHLGDDVWLPERGARVVAKAWLDPAFHARLLANGKAAIGRPPENVLSIL